MSAAAKPTRNCAATDKRNIQAVDRDVVHQICSGQVVLNLATAVKELVENSLDAGATVVEVRLLEYGSKLVEVIDNGFGVEEHNFEALTLKHHTSKLREFSDLMMVDTFGFRGEALSSLCAVSELSIITCHSTATCGTKLKFNSKGHIIHRAPCARQVGMTVTVENLFGSLPVRQKEFHRNIKREFVKMTQLLYAYCLVSTGVKIMCTNQNMKAKGRSVVVSTKGSLSVKENIACVFGDKQVQGLIEIQEAQPSEAVLEELGLSDQSQSFNKSFSIEGWISSCAHGHGRSTTDRQFFYVNSRPCEPAKIIRAVNEVYHQFNQHQYPFVFLNLKIDKTSVDVNVTPDKRQVFLVQEKSMIAIVKSSLLQLYQQIPSTFSFDNISIESRSSPVSNPPLSCPQSPSSPSFSSIRAALEQWSSPSVSTGRLLSSPSDRGTKRARESTKNEHLGNKAKFTCIKDFFGCKPKHIDDTNKDVEFQNTDASDGLVIDKSNVHYSELPVVENSAVQHFTCDEFKVKTEDGPRPNKYAHVSCHEIKEDLNCTVATDMYSSMNGVCLLEKDLAVDDTSRDVETMSTPSSLAVRLTKEDTTQFLKTDTKCSVVELTGCDVETTTKCPGGIVTDEERSSSLDCKIVNIEASISIIKQRLEEHNRTRKTKSKKTVVKFRADIDPNCNKKAEQELCKEISKDMFAKMVIIGQFNLGFIIARLESDLFIIDQHATDEKYNFEMLQKSTVLQNQKLVIPQKLSLTVVNETILIENEEVFRKNGFDFAINNEAKPTERVQLTAIPISKNWEFGKEDVDELLFMLQDAPHTMCRPSRVRAMFASRACRKSVMIGTALSISDMRKLINHMGELDQPWNCPHGRPTMRHLVNLDLIKSV